MLTFLLALLARVGGDEIKSWAPVVVASLVRVAVRHAPADQRDRLAEEWNSHIDSIPGDVSRIVAAVGFVTASIALNHSSDDLIRKSFDIALAAFMIFTLFPLLLFIALKIKFMRGSPVVIRVGGKLRFRCEKDDWVSRSNIDMLIGFADVMSGRASLVASSRRGDGSLPGLLRSMF